MTEANDTESYIPLLNALLDVIESGAGLVCILVLEYYFLILLFISF